MTGWIDLKLVGSRSLVLPRKLGKQEVLTIAVFLGIKGKGRTRSGFFENLITLKQLPDGPVLDLFLLIAGLHRVAAL